MADMAGSSQAQDRPEPISDAGYTFVIISLRKGKSHCTAAMRGERENVKEQIMQTPRLVQKEWKVMFRTLEQTFSPWRDHGGTDTCP